MKQLLSLFLFLVPCLAWAQYPSNGNQKITLGEQTTADGLIWRGVASIDTVTATSKITRANKQDTSAFLLLDTVTNLLWHYKTASNGWIQAGGGTSVTTFSGGTTGLTPSTATSGAVTLGGTLAVANGGTGSATQNFVDLTTTQSSIAGAKTFTSAVTATRFNPTASTLTGTGMFLPVSNTLGFSTNGTERLRLTSTALGLGVTPKNLSTDLPTFQAGNATFAGSASSNVAYVGTNYYYDQNAGVNKFIGSGYSTRFQTDNGSYYFLSSSASGSADATVSFTQAMTLDVGGELWIGYTADQGAYKLQVNSQIFATNATIATSDIRFKENIQPLDKGLEIINKLKPVKFNFISTTENNFSEFDEIGFIAQDVEGALSTELFAKAVVKKLDEDKDDSALGLMTEKLIPILTKAIQEQQAQIKALEQRIINLENK
jgi:hypothetical protein